MKTTSSSLLPPRIQNLNDVPLFVTYSGHEGYEKYPVSQEFAQYLHNLKAAIAGEKLAHRVDPNNLSKSLRDEAMLVAQLNLLEVIGNNITVAGE